MQISSKLEFLNSKMCYLNLKECILNGVYVYMYNGARTTQDKTRSVF